MTTSVTGKRRVTTARAAGAAAGAGLAEPLPSGLLKMGAVLALGPVLALLDTTIGAGGSVGAAFGETFWWVLALSALAIAPALLYPGSRKPV